MLTADRLREALSYDSETGAFCWRIARRGRHVGSLAGAPNGHGYLRITIDGKRYCAHRLAWFYVYGEWPAADIDHVDGNRSNNRIANLRQATRAENMQNMTESREFVGVSYCAQTGRWQAHISLAGKSIRIGRFETKEEARAAYLAKKATAHTFNPRPRRTAQ